MEFDRPTPKYGVVKPTSKYGADKPAPKGKTGKKRYPTSGADKPTPKYKPTCSACKKRRLNLEENQEEEQVGEGEVELSNWSDECEETPEEALERWDDSMNSWCVAQEEEAQEEAWLMAQEEEAQEEEPEEQEEYVRVELEDDEETLSMPGEDFSHFAEEQEEEHDKIFFDDPFSSAAEEASRQQKRSSRSLNI